MRKTKNLDDIFPVLSEAEVIQNAERWIAEPDAEQGTPGADYALVPLAKYEGTEFERRITRLLERDAPLPRDLWAILVRFEQYRPNGNYRLVLVREESVLREYVRKRGLHKVN